MGVSLKGVLREEGERYIYTYIHTYICAHQAAHLLQTRNLKVGAANEQVMMSELCLRVLAPT
jgi:hypothetical protein